MGKRIDFDEHQNGRMKKKDLPYNFMSFPRTGQYFMLFMLSVLEVVKERNWVTDGKKPATPKKEEPKKPWFKRVGEKVGFWLFFILISPTFYFRKCYGPFNTADRILAYYVDKNRPTGWKMLRLRVKTWFWVNIGLCVFDWYVETRGQDLEQAKRAYDMTWRIIRDGLLCAGSPEKTFTDIFKFNTSKKADYDWAYFDELHGGIFTEDVRKVLTTALQFDPASGAVFVKMYRELTDGIDPDFKAFARDVKDRFLRNSGLAGLVEVVGREVRRNLNIYCDKMRNQAQKDQNAEAAQKWAHASQCIDHIRAKAPVPQNDAEIERLMVEFCARANEAGSYTYAARQIDVPSESVALPAKAQAQLDDIAHDVKVIARGGKKKGQRYLKLGKTVIQFCCDLWETEQHHPERYPESKGRKVSKADVYGLYKEKLAKKGVEKYDDFVKAIDNGRKMMK